MNMEWVLAGVAMVAVVVLAGCKVDSGTVALEIRQPITTPDEARRVGETLDALHDAASKADEARYFALFAPNGVFLGTDGKERWTVEEFRKYAHPHFAEGHGWTYIPRPNFRFITLGPGGPERATTAWFDEVLDNAKFGECRGTGVLVKKDGQWLIAQYNLTVPVPNDLMVKVVEMIREKAK